MSLGIRPDQALNPEQMAYAWLFSSEKWENNELLQEE